MHSYRIHTLESAPEQAKPALQGLRQALGTIPNLAATMAESPTLLNSFVGAFGNFHASSFSGAQKQVLLLTNAVTNTCPWAVAFHSAMALKEGVDPVHVQAIRERRLPDDAQLAALSAFTKALIETRGHVTESDRASFCAAGFSADQVLEVIAGLAVSVLANYAGNITRPELEQPFQAHRWVA